MGVTPSFHNVAIDYPTHQVAVFLPLLLTVARVGQAPQEGDASTPAFAESVRLAQVLSESPDFNLLTDGTATCSVPRTSRAGWPSVESGGRDDHAGAVRGGTQVAHDHAEAVVERYRDTNPVGLGVSAQLTGEEPIQLDRSLRYVNLSQLDGTEHEQIRYWQPVTVGDLLFNYWD